jgi:hypothetical protein
MLRRRPTTSEPTDASAYSRRRAIADSAWATQDRVRSSLSAAARGSRQALERAAFPLQERILWPLSDRAETMAAPARAVSFAAVVLLAAAAGVAGLIWAAPDKPERAPATSEVAAVSAPATDKAAPEQPPEPTLHGAAPVFEPAPDEATATEVDPAKAIANSSSKESGVADPAAAPPATAAASSSAASSPAQASSVDGPPAGPAAVSVAREFSGAFVVYETGGSEAEVRRAFGATATPQLAKALLRRPPRLPANVEVPKARVLNVVPGPSHGKVYSVSVSLLRVGQTSELRLEMERRKDDGWRVTNVLG